MCFAFDAHPPELPADLVLPRMAGGARAELLELASADGTRFSAALAQADGGRDVGVVILPDVRGLYRFYEEVALRLAERGYTTIAIDYFGRTAGAAKRGDDFEYQDHVKQTIAPYKYPRAIEYVAQLPKTETGKLRRFTLRQMAAGGPASPGIAAE